jgi:threonine/homoserine/homoserine lactone efflux protein
MDAPPGPLGLVAMGAALGWNVAWIPGPINAEILRRGARRGFGAAFAVGAGATCSDFLWATAVSLGAGAVVASPAVGRALGVASTVLLTGLAAFLLRGALRSLRAWRRGEAPPQGSAALETNRGGWLFGFLTALTSPFNLAFWAGAVGPVAARGAGPALTLLFGLSVVLGAVSWCVVLSAASRLGARVPGAAWDATLRAVAAGFLVWIAVRTAVFTAGG